MQPKWLIESDLFDCTKSIIQSLQKYDIPYKEVKTYLYSDDFLDIFPPNDCVIFYGSLNFAKNIRKKTKWIPGTYYNQTAFNCVQYYSVLGKYLLNENYIMLPYNELHRRKEFLYDTFGEDRAVFIRPNRGDKIFTGKIVLKENYEKDVELFNFYQMPADELVIVAKPINIESEWRFISVKNEIITGSQYRKNNTAISDVNYPEGACLLAQEIAQQYQPDLAYVIDICLTRSGEFKLMEVGCFSCAGLYLCDTDKIVNSVSSAALDEWQSYQ